MGTTLDLSELDLKIGQLFMTGIPGPELDRGTETLIRDCNLGGVILFSRNIRDPLQVAELCIRLQDTATSHHGLPLIIAMDQEGGRVSRLGQPFTQFPGNAAIGKDPEPLKRAEEYASTTAREMKLVGLNMNLAPVLDVQKGEPEAHLKGRTFGEDPEKVALLGRRVVRFFQEHGILAVAKHFPGLGLAPCDPHFHLPRIESALQEMEQVHLPPFQAAIHEGVYGIMSSHAIYPAFDPERPATLSARILTGLLREKMGFDGLILTDDLEMGAIASHWGVAEGAAAAFGAGADLLLICKDQSHVLHGLERIRSKVLRGEISLQRVHESHERILRVRSLLLDQREWISLGNVKRYFKVGA